MPCYRPIRAWQTDDKEIVFAERGHINRELTIQCGQCRGCRLEKSRQWAMRCVHESKMHKYNCFVTLTYDDENLPMRFWTGKYKKNGEKSYGGNLHYRDVQLFLKRLRKALSKKDSYGIAADQRATSPQQSTHEAIRFYVAGEYGEDNNRPHYHICLFGIDFRDKKYITTTETGHKLYESETLKKIWKKGFTSIGELTFESAAYTARYIMKKQTGQMGKTAYTHTCQETGELLTLNKEFNQMSRAKGIGLTWLQKFKADVYPHAKVVIRGKQTNTPKYYDRKYKESNPLEWETIEHERHKTGKAHWEEQLEHRLKAREIVAAAKIQQLKRKI